MAVLLYASQTSSAGRKLKQIVKSLIPEEETEIYLTIDSLSRRLRQPRNNLSIAVLLAFTKKDLSDLLSIGDLFWGFRIILILPDREQSTIAKGHIFRPRFITYADNNFLEVAAVLDKMLEKDKLSEEENGQ